MSHSALSSPPHTYIETLQQAGKMVWNRVKFPNMAVTFMGKNARTRLRDNQFVFRVEPHYTKHEIKEYLTKVYDLPVAKVNTMNYEGASAVYRGYMWAIVQVSYSMCVLLFGRQV